MNNIFQTFPEFLELDNRTKRPTVKHGTNTATSLTYAITPEFMFERHKLLLPIDMIQGKTILDLGSCLGASGAWALANGAEHYTGVEVQPDYADLSKQLLSARYPGKFKILTTSFEEFHAMDKYDIVLCSGSLHAVLDIYSFIEKIADSADKLVVLDTIHPFNGYRSLYPNATGEQLREVGKTISAIEISEHIKMTDARGLRSLAFSSSIPSLQSLITLFKSHNWSYDPELYSLAESKIDYYYDLANHNRFMARFVPGDSDINYFYKQATDPNPKDIWSWTGNSTTQ